ncbi:hypothetical protein NCLIV_056045 [Neospora caninum Liverpool]|uniref:Ku domain-containing protein n=1 Tax=Neospora caninum (strain Liverpool) TaxID=572307 RepID=F0VN84_NEOCL|nr:hypothetical protein NCLIV_056045 [Neospora caninum Liverpool]CBZ55180.1 hypothetical protein NCLIV_056045 [Neospora caninum Liverpool]|eukprot:XP_003885208.1 hypothetical protein NCLIV_056045 [Neospora caninum Liverpool]
MHQSLRGEFPTALPECSEAFPSARSPAWSPTTSPSVGVSHVAARTPTSSPSPGLAVAGSTTESWSSRSSFHAMKRAALVYVQRLAATSAKVDVGVVCFGSCRTNNPLAIPGGQPGDEGDEEDDGYRHVDVAVQPESASWKLVKAVEEIENSDHRSDAIDAVVVAVDTVEKTYGPKLAQNDVSFLMFSDCQSRPAAPEDIPAVQERLQSLGIRMHVIVVDGSLPEYPPILSPPSTASLDRLPSPVHPTLPSLARLASTLIPLRSFLASPFLRAFFSPPKRLSTKCRVNLEISKAFVIPVYVFVRTRKESLPTFRKRVFVGSSCSQSATRRRTESSLPRGDAAVASDEVLRRGEKLTENEEDGWRDVKVDRFYYRANDPDRTPVKYGEQDKKRPDGISILGRDESEDEGTPKRDAAGGYVHRLYAYRYGKQLVAVSAVEQQAFKEQTEAGLVVLGVTRRDGIQRWWNLGPAEYVTCALNNRPSLVALRSLVLALERLDSVLLCSFVWRAGYPAKLVALLPHVGGREAGRRPLSDSWQASEAIKREKEELDDDTREDDWTYGLHLIYLPVAEDMLELRLPSLPSVTPSQLQAVETLIDSLTLPDGPPLPLKTGEMDTPLQEEAAESDGEGKKRIEDWKEVRARRRALQASASSPAGWQTNTTMEIAADPASLSISSFASEKEWLDLRKIHNPTLQRYYQLLVYRHYNPASPPVALREEGNAQHELPPNPVETAEVNRRVLNSFWYRSSPVESLFTQNPPSSREADLDRPDETLDERNAGPDEAQVDADLKAAFPQATAPEAQKALRRQREVQKLLLGEVIRKQKELILRDVKVSGDSAGTDAQQEKAVEDSQVAKERRDELERLERAMEEKERQEKIEALKALHVNSVNPVRDFQRLLEVKETDLTEKAIQEMTDMIWRFLRAAGGPPGVTLATPPESASGLDTEGLHNFRRQQHLGKALVCVEALREGCRKELEGAKFNEFLGELKAELSREHEPTDDGFRTFWNLLKSRQVGLITHAEDPRVELDPSRSLSIYDEQLEARVTKTSPAVEKPVDPVDVDDVLDLVE